MNRLLLLILVAALALHCTCQMDTLFKVDYSRNQLTAAQATANNSMNTPALVGTGVATALFVFPPCFAIHPHYHPEASESNILHQGSVNFNVIIANSSVVSGTLEKLQIVTYPQGFPHIIFNPNKETAVVQVIFNQEKPGLFILDQFGAFPDEDTIAGLGQEMDAYSDFKKNINDAKDSFITRAKGDAYKKCLAKLKIPLPTPSLYPYAPKLRMI